MTTPSIGYLSTFPDDDITQTLGVDFSKVGMCSTSSDADPSVFPFDKVVRFTSTDPAYLGKLGTGDLYAAVIGLNDQLGGKGADLFVVRVASGAAADPAEKLAQTQAAVIGDPGARTGLWALRSAPQVAKGLPRLWYAGYTAEAGPNGADNPVRAALAVHLEAVKAVAIVDVDPTSKIKAIAARELMSSKRMMPLGVAAMVYETVNGAAVLKQRPMAPRILGLIVAADNNYRDGMPFDSFCNRPVLGIADINRDIDFDLGDGATEGQLMLAADVAVVVQGESATAGAIADGGFVFLGVESAASDDTWSQLHQVRGADFIDVEFMKLSRKFIGGRYTPRRAESLLKTFGLMLNDHVANEDILGYELTYPEILNSVAKVREGRFKLRTRHEQAPVIRVVENETRRYPEGITALVRAISAAAGTQTGTV